jgi:hypothetical protein
MIVDKSNTTIKQVKQFGIAVPILAPLQEFTVSIELWNTLTPFEKSEFLGNNRLFLMRYNMVKENNRFTGKVESVVFCKHENKIVVKLCKII